MPNVANKVSASRRVLMRRLRDQFIADRFLERLRIYPQITQITQIKKVESGQAKNYETRRYGDTEIRRYGDGATRGIRNRAWFSPRRRVSPSPCRFFRFLFCVICGLI